MMMMPRALLVVLALFGLFLSAMPSESGRLIRKGAGPGAAPAPSPPPPGTTFFENLGVRTLATDGYCFGQPQFVSAGPAAGNHRVYVAYMNNLSCSGGVMNIK